MRCGKLRCFALRDDGNHALFISAFVCKQQRRANLWISAVLVNERDDSADVLLFDDVESFGTVDEDTVKYIQHTWTQRVHLSTPVHSLVIIIIKNSLVMLSFRT